MKKISVDMGCYYTSYDEKSLVKSITRATNSTGENIIVYANILEGGLASAPMYMSENDFIETYVK